MEAKDLEEENYQFFLSLFTKEKLILNNNEEIKKKRSEIKKKRIKV